MSPISILVVDDSPKWRKLVHLILDIDSNLKIVSEVGDGASAVKAAKDFRPAVALLDISLPDVNGIEVGRNILKVCPETKIIFVTQESDVDLVEEGLAIGACGYVLKVDAGSELVTAIRCAFRAGRYISRTVPPIEKDSE